MRPHGTMRLADIDSRVRNLCEAAGLTRFKIATWFQGASLEWNLKTRAAVLRIPHEEDRQYVGKYYAVALASAAMAKGATSFLLQGDV